MNFKNCAGKAFILNLFFILGCTDSNVVATIDGKSIYTQEVDQSFGGRLASQIYEMRRNALEDIIEQKLLEKAAKEKNMSVEDFLKKEVDAKISEPSEEEIKAIYEVNKDRFGDSFETAKSQIVGALKQNRANVNRRQFLASLREKSKVEIKLKKPPVQRIKVSVDDDPSVGPQDAKITVIEFSDFQCPFCGRARETVNQMTSVYKDKLKYVFRDFPLSFHKDAFAAHVAAQCANEQGKFWEYNQALFKNQNKLKPENLKQHAKDVGLDTNSFNQCLDSNKYAEEVQKDLNDGVEAGVSGTPAFFVNGIQISGAQPFSKFKEIIEEELKQ